MKNIINIIESIDSGCPLATVDIDVNLKNRQAAIDKYHYGPANPAKPGDYWAKAAKRWNTSQTEVKSMTCANCAAFDVSDSMRQCIAKGIKGKEDSVAASATINLSDLGYCNFLHFKCAGSRTCAAWVTGGPITQKDKNKKLK